VSPVGLQRPGHPARSVLRRSALGKTPHCLKHGPAQQPRRPHFGHRSRTTPASRRTDRWFRSQGVLPRCGFTEARLPSAFGHSAPAIAADLTYQAGCSTFRQRSTCPHPADCRMRAPSGPQVRRVQVFEVSRRMGITESTPPTLVTAVSRRDAYMHLAPGRGIWCYDQSNTISGHGIPSGPLDAPERYCRRPRRLQEAAQATSFRHRRGTDRLVAAWPVGVEVRRYRRRLGGLHGMRYPLRSRLNLGRQNTVAVGSGLISG